MLSSEGKQTDTSESGDLVLPGSHQWEQVLDREQIFRLIESTLSFEACLYHQILPFNIKNNNLVLGMVNPQDSAAIDYVNRILPHINCIMATQPITGDTHRTVLSAYLNHKNKAQPTGAPVHKSCSNIAHADRSDPQSEGLTPTTQDTHSSFQPQEEETRGTVQPGNLHVLQLTTPDVMSSVEELTALPPKKLLEQLLWRVLADGIGRLYLERQPYHGRILWSENGVLQSVLEKVPLSVFQGVLNELKRFAFLPMTTVVEPKQVEKECLYQQNRLLLRLRVMPGMYGEEATLQVLRGAALKFYQQQQLARVSRDALVISQQLNYKLHELKERLTLNQRLNTRQLEAFNTLNRIIENLDQQIKILTDISEPPKNS